MKIAILGAGQLSQMLALAAHPLGLETHVLSLQSHEPAWGPATGHLGDPEQIADINPLLASQLLTFESEFYNAEKLKKSLAAFTGRIFPNLKALGTLRDRKTQKEFLLHSKLPTAPFMVVSTALDLNLATQRFGGNFVLKLRTHGYDGRGTFYSRKGNKKMTHHLHSLIDKFPQGFIAEAFVPFRRELALMAFRSADGSFAFFPLVESIQKDSRCDLVLGPATHPKLISLQDKIKKALRKIDYVGAIAFELFDDGRELWVNEVAPRVHNSGHYSQQALNFDQFTLHLMCGLGERLPTIKPLAKAYGMINLIGQSQNLPTWSLPSNARLHWYNKSENRPGRKMGHLNAVGSDRAQVQKDLTLSRKKFNL
jgi:5-(carboxyamino)imidazole ribonucleotide synthase